MERTPGMAWCVTENKSATRSCGADNHDVGPLDSSGKRSAYLLAPSEGQSTEEIVENLTIGRESEQG
jgi:hypothetical protein